MIFSIELFRLFQGFKNNLTIKETIKWTDFWILKCCFLWLNEQKSPPLNAGLAVIKCLIFLVKIYVCWENYIGNDKEDSIWPWSPISFLFKQYFNLTFGVIMIKSTQESFIRITMETIFCSHINEVSPFCQISYIWQRYN